MKIYHWILIVLLIGIIFSKSYIVGLTDFPNYESYYSIRQVEHIQDTGMPLINDPLSYQGRSTFSNPLSYYIFTLFSFFTPLLILFKYGGIVLSLIAYYLIFHISHSMYKKPWISLLLVSIALLNPTVFGAHLNTLIPSSIFIILFLLLIKFFFDKNHTAFVIVVILATLTSPFSLVLVLGFFFYFLLLKLETLRSKTSELELLFFSAIFIIWFNLISYKKLLFMFGSHSLWQSIPFEIQSTLFSQLSITQALNLVGIIPLALGIYGIYSSLFEKRNRKVLFIISFALSFGILTWLGFLPFIEGLVYIIFSFVLVSGHSIVQIQSFFNKTITPWLSKVLVVVVLIISAISFSTVFIFQDAYVELAPSEDEIETAITIGKYVPRGETVISHIKHGHLISTLSSRKNYYDEHFVLAPQSQQRYVDARKIFLSQSQASVLSLLLNYDVSYIWVSDLTRSTYPTTTSLFEESECFDKIFSTETTEVYKVSCILRS